MSHIGAALSRVSEEAPWPPTGVAYSLDGLGSVVHEAVLGASAFLTYLLQPTGHTYRSLPLADSKSYPC